MGTAPFTEKAVIHLMVLLSLFAVLCPVSSRAADTYFVTLGVADRNHGVEPVEDTYLTRFGARWDRYSREAESTGRWYVRSFWEVVLGYWQWNDNPTVKHPHGDLAEIALTPVFRLDRRKPFANGWAPFLEGGIGVHLISKTTVSSRELSTNFHFGTDIGVGMYLDRRRRWDVGLFLQHLSNAGVKTPNPGINFYLVKIGYSP